jgi:putative ABC transport system ATP-binding protein
MPALTVVDLKRSYTDPTGKRSVVVDVAHLELEESRQMALRGGSGSGKTTLLNLIAGILRPDSGRIFVAGQELTALSESRRDRVRGQHIGYIFQTFNLLQGYTALENVRLAMSFGRGIDEHYARHLLERVGLGDRMHYRPRQLSVGQQQRVAVARALANHPTLVLADEPTGNLDRRNADAALALIREVCRESKAALLLVSHDEHVLAQYEEVLNMEQINRGAAVSGGALTGGPGISVPGHDMEVSP